MLIMVGHLGAAAAHPALSLTSIGSRSSAGRRSHVRNSLPLGPLRLADGGAYCTDDHQEGVRRGSGGGQEEKSDCHLPPLESALCRGR
eukprot:2923119-Pyramimonas_sp.AAC.1